MNDLPSIERVVGAVRSGLREPLPRRGRVHLHLGEGSILAEDGERGSIDGRIRLGGDHREIAGHERWGEERVATSAIALDCAAQVEPFARQPLALEVEAGLWRVVADAFVGRGLGANGGGGGSYGEREDGEASRHERRTLRW